MGAVVLVLLLVMTLLGRAIVSQLTRGIGRLTHHIEALAACDLSENIEASGPAEFAQILRGSRQRGDQLSRRSSIDP